MTAIAIVGGIGAVGTFVWWVIANSPVVQDLDKRLTRLDDPQVGKVTQLEGVFQWAPTLKRADR